MAEPLPTLLPDMVPPWVLGTAELTHRAFAGASLDELLQAADRPAATMDAAAARALDGSVVYQLALQKPRAMAMQEAALSLCQVYRVRGGYDPAAANPLRMLVMMAPGDLMVNAPLDFITRTLNVQLDLMYLVPGQGLPAAIPDHDVAYVGGGDARDPAALERRASLFRSWPRPVLNEPHRVSALARDSLARRLADAPGLESPECTLLTRAALQRGWEGAFPILVRPAGSHAGSGLAKVEGPEEVAAYLQAVDADAYYVTRFVDYRSADGQYRKYRIAFIGGAPFLCHLGISTEWMIHYLNAGMTSDVAKRDEEALAMDTFHTGFARRHEAAFAALTERVGLDYFTVDCGESPDGRLLVFEADAEAIIHMMDPPEVFPYKPRHMQAAFEAFAIMAGRRAATARCAVAA